MLARSGPAAPWPRLDVRGEVGRDSRARFHGRRAAGTEPPALEHDCELLPEFAALPDGLVLDGELVAWGDDGLRSFPRLCERMLHRQPGIAVTYMVFDALEVEGVPTVRQPYRERRAILEALELPQPAVVPDLYDDGDVLFRVVCDRGMEGVVAKRLTSRYVPGDRSSWIKVKNREYWRVANERTLALRPRVRLTV
jgi:ATP-dependent DNA ligase